MSSCIRYAVAAGIIDDMKLYVCTYICMRVCGVCVHAYIYIYIHECAYMRVCVCVCVLLQLVVHVIWNSVCVCGWVRARM